MFFETSNYEKNSVKNAIEGTIKKWLGQYESIYDSRIQIGDDSIQLGDKDGSEGEGDDSCCS